MTHPTDLLLSANKNLWYLREGDYLPEPLQSFDGGKGITRIEQLEEMRSLGTVYPTRETAAIISQKVRALLSQASFECFVSRSNTPDNA